MLCESNSGGCKGTGFTTPVLMFKHARVTEAGGLGRKLAGVNLGLVADSAVAVAVHACNLVHAQSACQHVMRM
jgi:hypothetical protein